MPIIRCPYCDLSQYAPATYSTIPECVGCGRQFEVPTEVMIAPVVAAEREARARPRP